MLPSIKYILKLLKRNPKLAKPALKASVALPSSGITVDNAQGASAAVTELFDALSAALEH